MRFFASRLQSFHIRRRRLLTIPFGTFSLSLAVFVSQETRPVADDGSGKVERARKHVAVAARSSKTPLRVKGRRGRQKTVGHEARGKRRDGRLDVVAAVRLVVAGIGVAQRRVRPRERVRWSLRSRAEDRAGAG